MHEGGAEESAAILVSPDPMPASLDGTGVVSEPRLLERPELAVAAAFVGGLLLAALVRRLGR